jgi:uncharacterized membrane protein
MLSAKTLIATGVLGIVQSIYFYTQLPERVAIHFGSGGLPDSWASNESNLAISVFLYIFLATVFIAVPRALKYIPVRFISFPNREYWLAEERRELTIKQIGGLFNMYGAALMIFFLVLGYFVFRANISDPVVLNEGAVWVSAALLLVFTIVWLFVLFRRFRLPGQRSTNGANN